MSSVQVAEEGNRRKGIMDSNEIEQCIHDIVDWFERKGDLTASSLSTIELNEMEKKLDVNLPKELKLLYKKQNGNGLYFDEYAMLSGDELLSKQDGVYGKWDCWKSDYIAFAGDVDDNIVMIDTSDEDAIYECCDDGKGKLLADSFSEYLEKYRNRLLSGKFEFVEDTGVIERARK